MFTDMLHRYALVSHLLLACSIGHISTTVTGFYDIIIHFLSNKTCVAILYNYCLMLFIFCCKIPVMIFIGQLTRLETEELIESLRSYLTDSILFLVLSKPKHLGKELLVSDLIRSLAILLAIKAFHILLSNRLSHMFEMEIPSFGRVLRVSSFIYVLSLVNVFLINFFVHNLNKKNTFTIWVIFELLGMMQSLLFSTIKFVVNLLDLYQQNGLVNKVTILFYVELLQDITSLVTFTTFMVLFFVNNPINIPIYMIIDIIHVAKNLSGRIKMLIEYRKLSKVLNSRFPLYVATNPGETCIICRDGLDDNSRKIDCGHAFHLNCLKSWLFQHASCPSCRTPIYSSSITEAPLIDVNSILYNMEQRVLIAIRRLFKLGEVLLGLLVTNLLKTWPFNKVFKRRYKFNNKLCKIVLILSNKMEKHESYEYYYLDKNNNMLSLFDSILNYNDKNYKETKNKKETKLSLSRSNESSRSNTRRSGIGDEDTPKSHLSFNRAPRLKSMPFIHTNAIGSITASIELNMSVVNVIKRYKLNQQFYLTPNSTTKVSRKRSLPRSGHYSKERMILEAMFSLLNEKETTTDVSLKEIQSSLMVLFPLFLASMGALLGTFTQSAILSELYPENVRIRNNSVNFTNITTSDSRSVYMKLVSAMGETENIDITSIVGLNGPMPSFYDVLSDEVKFNTPRSRGGGNAAFDKINSTTDTSTTGTYATSNYMTNRNHGSPMNTGSSGRSYSNAVDYIGIDENLIKKQHVKFLVSAKDYSLLMLKLNKKPQLNVTDLLVNLQTIQTVVKNHL